MKYAIDRYGVSLEKEVRADIFYNKYISQKSSRFFCPECGEPVFWSSRGGVLPDRFSHYKKTENTPECDRRVDGRSGLNLYERVGLPVYLTAKASNQFCLNIGFPPVGERLLSEADRRGMRVYITGSEYQRTVLVNASHFFEDSITLVPVNFIPKLGKNFTVTIEPDESEEAGEIRRKWSDYGDGFWYGGAIFTYEETGGKKIRKGDSVSPHRLYYVIAEQFHPPQEIFSKMLGTILLSKKQYSVYQVSIQITTENLDRYKKMSNYLREQFDVWLLQTPPELIPLWPPVTEQGVLIPVKNHGKMYCAVSSGNDEPSVYRYDEAKVSSLTVENNGSGVQTVEFRVSSQGMTLSVDRKYAGREVSFQAKEIVPSEFMYQLSVEKESGNLLAWKDVTRDILSEAFTLNANAKMEMYIGSRDKLFRRVSIQRHRVAVAAWNNSEEILFVAESGVLFHYKAAAADRTRSVEEPMTVNKIREWARGECVPVPYWITHMLFEWRKEGFVRGYEEIRRITRGGKIPIGLLIVLYDYYCARGHHI